jgi:hypothetical protein
MGLSERKQLRHPSSEVILFSIPVPDIQGIKHINTSGIALNVSSGGACIRTAFALQPGHVLSIVGTPGMKRAMVQWVQQDQSYYVAGIMNV